jgi:2-polyprenyl-6-methoxyphenol hydroxylase-like FAD-dependent oxidoreductase
VADHQGDHHAEPPAGPRCGPRSGLRVAVIGAGIGGLTVSAALARAGVAGTIYEQATRLTEVGAGIQMSPNATRLLHGLGLTAQLGAAAVAPDAVEMRRWQDNTVLGRSELGVRCAQRYGAPYYTLHRGDLHRTLLGLVRRAGGAIHLGRRCIAVSEHDDHVQLRFADGSLVEADLVIGADGIHSVTRQAVCPDQVLRSRLTVHRGLVPARRLPHVRTPPRVVIWLGPGQHCVCYPTSGHINVVASMSAGIHPVGALGSATELLAAYTGWHPVVLEILSALDEVRRWPVQELAAPACWHTERIVLLGDAAHAMLPFGAQGGNQAIEDAVALATCLRGATGGQIPAALRCYAQVRTQRLAQVRGFVNDNARNHVLDDGEPQRLRDAALAAPRPPDAQDWLYGYDAQAAAFAALGALGAAGGLGAFGPEAVPR